MNNKPMNEISTKSKMQNDIELDNTPMNDRSMKENVTIENYNIYIRKQNPIRKYLFIFLGTICFIIGAIGIIMPIIPTTPFLLLTAWFYLRSSEVLHQYLMKHRVFGRYLRNYQNKSIVRKDKYITIITLYIGITISCFMVDLWILRMMMVGIALGVTAHLNSLKVMVS